MHNTTPTINNNPTTKEHKEKKKMEKEKIKKRKINLLVSRKYYTVLLTKTKKVN